MGKLKDRAGIKYGRLTAVSIGGKNKYNQIMWNCLCDCGNEVLVIGCSLESGLSKSCGCYHKEMTKTKNTKHGMCDTGLYNSWDHMLQRCKNKNNTAYRYYGGKGITVINEWQYFINFKEWALLNGYKCGLVIDRINSDKGYCPENCQWITKADNARKAVIVRENNKCKKGLINA